MNHDVVVNTSADPEVGIEEVFTSMEDGVYGVGQDVPITVVFTAPVSLWLSGLDVRHERIKEDGTLVP